MTTPVDELIRRLDDERPSVRRLAAIDLASSGDLDTVAARLRRGEPDEKAALTMIRVLGDAGADGARPALWGLYQDAQTPARVAHAAIRAHDRIELRGGTHGR